MTQQWLIDIPGRTNSSSVTGSGTPHAMVRDECDDDEGKLANGVVVIRRLCRTTRSMNTAS